MKKVPLLPGGDDDDRYRLELSPVLSTLADLQTKKPSVTAIIKGSESEEAAFRLDRWEKQKVMELGREGFEKQQHETKGRGTQFHSLVQQYLQKRIEPDFNEDPPKPEIRLFLSAYNVLKRVQRYITGEIISTNPCLFYLGKIDSLVIIDGQVTLVEWKTSEKQKPTLASTYDAPLQTAAYIGALNRDKKLIIPGYTPPTTPLTSSPLTSSPPLATLPPLANLDKQELLQLSKEELVERIRHLELLQLSKEELVERIRRLEAANLTPPPSATPIPPLATPVVTPPLTTPLAQLPPASSPHFVTRAKIVVCYTDGSPATILDLPLDVLQSYWPMWLNRWETYWVKKLVDQS